MSIPRVVIEALGPEPGPELGQGDADALEVGPVAPDQDIDILGGALSPLEAAADAADEQVVDLGSVERGQIRARSKGSAMG